MRVEEEEEEETGGGIEGSQKALLMKSMLDLKESFDMRRPNMNME